MNIEELRSTVESYRSGLKEKSGSVCMFTESGPVGMSLIDAILAVLEAQDRRIEEIARKVG